MGPLITPDMVHEHSCPQFIGLSSDSICNSEEPDRIEKMGDGMLRTYSVIAGMGLSAIAKRGYLLSQSVVYGRPATFFPLKLVIRWLATDSADCY